MTPPPGGVFIFGRADLAPLALIVLAPVLMASHLLLGILLADPLLYTGGLTLGQVAGPVQGVPYIDPNNGVTTQALGVRAALDWVSGTVPWWNPYSGAGLPLAAEYQPAALSPLTLLMLLPNGMVWHQVVLQLLAGLGTYGLLRQLGLGRLAATTGALLYGFNGTLAWFAHGPATAAPYLPWLLWGIERAWAKASLGMGRGWRMISFAIGFSLLSGFPETAYIGGLLALAWSIARGAQAAPAVRKTYAARVAIGGIVGLGIAAPQWLAFFQYLPQAFLGGHEERFVHEALPAMAALPGLIAPYAHGPIFAFTENRPHIHTVWGMIGGYATLALLVAAAHGFLARRWAMRWLLAGWIVLALGKTYGIEPAVTLLNLVPGVPLAAFYRYAPPSWCLALVILAAVGLDALARGMPRRGAAMLAATLVLVAGVAGGTILGAHLQDVVLHSVRERNWALGSAVVAVGAALACLWLLRSPARRAPALLAAVLAAEAMLMYAIPTFSNPRAGRIDTEGIGFLRENLGLQRFFSLGPIAPNYGAYFGIASLNHNYLPVSRRWTEWMLAHLDSASTDPVVFDGARGGPASSAHELRRNIASYRAAGVKYIVARPGQDPFAPQRAGGSAPGRVYSSAAMDIYELAEPSPYFEFSGSRCDAVIEGRTRLSATCDGPAKLVRRELHFPGWTAQVNGHAAPLAQHGSLFQSIELPAGRSAVRFAYSPPHVGWAWLACLAAWLTLAGARWPRARGATAQNRISPRRV